jgi:hypothetical protein
MAQKYAGWGKPYRMKYAHYFKDSPLSLCGIVIFIGAGEENLDNASHTAEGNCRVCEKARQAREKVHSAV